MAHHTTPPPPPGRSSTAWLILTAVLVVVMGLLGAGVALAYAGWTQEAILGLLIAVGSVAGTVLPLVAKLLTDHTTLMDETRQQTETLLEVKENTNGKMHDAIKSAVNNALDEREKP